MEKIKKPLEGIKVIELANYVAAPIVGRMCADLGAEVIKIEGRGGEAWRVYSAESTNTDFTENPLFDVFNCGKKSISLNIKTEEGNAILFRLLENADVFLTNIRKNSLERLGVWYDQIKERFPRLIYATLTGYGYEGPDCDAPGFDNIAFWGRSGFSVDMCYDAPGCYPVNSRNAQGDSISGTTFFGALMTALYQREKTGRGDFVTMSLLNAGIWKDGGNLVMAQEPYSYSYPEKRAAGLAINLPYRCSDNEWIRCSFFEYDRYAPRFYKALGVTEEIERIGVHDNKSMREHADAVVPLFEKAFAKKSSAEWLQIFKELDVVCGKLYHYADVLRDEQTWANQYLQKYQCTNGAVRIITTNPVRLGSQGVLKCGAPAEYGAATKDVLLSLGYQEDQVQELETKGVLK